MVSIGDMLVDAGLVRERLEECRKDAADSGDSLDQVLLRKDYLDEGTVLQIYAKHLGFEFRKSLEGTAVPEDFVNRVPVQFARNYNLIALGVSDDNVLKVATCAPLEPHPMDDLSALIGFEVDPVLAPDSRSRGGARNDVPQLPRNVTESIGLKRTATLGSVVLPTVPP